MARIKTLQTFQVNTVGDLLDVLAEIAKNPTLSDVLDACIESDCGNTFDRFRITEETLSDKSKILNFELLRFEI